MWLFEKVFCVSRVQVRLQDFVKFCVCQRYKWMLFSTFIAWKCCCRSSSFQLFVWCCRQLSPRMFHLVDPLNPFVPLAFSEGSGCCNSDHFSWEYILYAYWWFWLWNSNWLVYKVEHLSPSPCDWLDHNFFGHDSVTGSATFLSYCAVSSFYCL